MVWQTDRMGGTPKGKDKPGPSYEDGRLHDPRDPVRVGHGYDGLESGIFVGIVAG